MVIIIWFNCSINYSTERGKIHSHVLSFSNFLYVNYCDRGALNKKIETLSFVKFASRITWIIGEHKFCQVISKHNQKYGVTSCALCSMKLSMFFILIGSLDRYIGNWSDLNPFLHWKSILEGWPNLCLGIALNFGFFMFSVEICPFPVGGNFHYT